MYNETPVIESKALSCWLKLENTQPSGSFKSRGLTHLVATSLEQNPKAHFYASSGGNAGLAVSEAAYQASVPNTIVIPEVTPAKAVQRMRDWGSEVILKGAMWAEADAYARSLLENDPNGVYCHPFDNPVIWQGHSTLVDELKDKPEAIVLSVGGGGLFLGVMRGLERRGWLDVRVYAVETSGSNCFAQSIAADKCVVTGPPQSIAKSLGSTYVPKEALEYYKKGTVESLIVSDEQALDGCRQLAFHHNFIVEPACGASIAATKLVKEKPLTIVCGGSLWSAELLVAEPQA